jgi:dipeptidyl aminopeptidase/acylaminoacyl peptidase
MTANTARRPFLPEDLYRLRVVADPQLSPDGTQVAYLVARHDEAADEVHTCIWIAAADGRGAPRQFTSGKKDNSPRWRPDGGALLFVGDRGKGAQLFLAPLDGGEPHAITTAEHGVSQPAWSPDGTRVAYIARVGPSGPGDDATPAQKRAPRVITNLSWRFDGIGVFDERRPQLFVVEVGTGTAKQLTKGDFGHESPAWSPDGTQLAFSSDRRRQRHDEVLRSDLWVVPATGGKARRVTRGRGSAAFPLWSPDGRQIAFVGGEHGDEFWAKSAHLMVIDAAATNGEPTTVAGGFARLGVPEGPAMAWTPDGKAIDAIRIERGTGGIRRYGLDGSEKAVLTGERRVGAFTFSADRKRIAFVSTWVGEPSEISTARITAAGAVSGEQRVSHANDELVAEVALASCRRIVSVAPDGTESESFLLLPPGAAKTARRPLVLDVHGGPHGWHPGTFTTTWAISQTLAGAGYAVLLCNPRGSSGYGDEFLAGCVGDWGGGDFDDLMAAVDKVVADGVVDSKQLYVWGYSYGGFMTSWIVGHTNRFRAAVVGAPVIDQLSMIGTSDIPHFSAFELGGYPWERPEEFAKRSPLTYAPDIRTPVLLLHQDGDLRCPIGQSDELFAALKLLGKEVEYVRYPGGFHALGVAPSHLVDRARRTVEWFKRHK